MVRLTTAGLHQSLVPAPLILKFAETQLHLNSASLGTSVPMAILLRSWVKVINH